MKRYELELYLTTVKYFAVEAESLEEAKSKATDEARKHMGEDWRSLEIVESNKTSATK
tara:strand:+ start:3363 stop:3536 length:174 start_codon:yes stop_codon:yes gene_type:complete